MIVDFKFIKDKINNCDSDFYYDEDNIKKNIVKAKKSTKEKVRVESTLKIFFMLSRIIIKNTNNLKKMIFNDDKNFFLSDDEIVSEFYIILTNCVRNYKMFESDFFWYFNSSLIRHSYKLKQKYYEKRNDCVEAGNQPHNSFINTLDFDFKNMGLDSVEIKITNYKIETNKSLKNFLIDNELTSNEYYNRLKNVQKKISKYYG